MAHSFFRKTFIITVLQFVFWASIACGDGKPEEFIRDQEQKEKFTPLVKTGQPRIYERAGIIMVPRVQNFIQLDGRRYRVAVTIDRKLSSTFTDRDYVNYEWRRVRGVGEKFRRLFPRDMLVLKTFRNTSDFDQEYRSGSDERPVPPFMVFLVVETDTNGNGILDDQGDVISLHILDMATMAMHRIGPPGMTMRYNASLKFHGLGVGSRRKFFLLFEARDPKSNRVAHYLYHVDSRRLEELNPLLLEKYR